MTSTIFQISVFIAADEITTTEIEAKAVNASFSIDEEVVIQWENIQTNSATLIDELKESKY